MTRAADRRTVEAIRSRYAQMEGQAGADIRLLLSVIDDVIQVVARLDVRAEQRSVSEGTGGGASELAIRSLYEGSDSEVATDVLFLLSAIHRIRVVLEPFQARAPEHLRADQDAADERADRVDALEVDVARTVAVDEWIADNPQRPAGWEPPPRPGGYEREIGL